MMDLNILNKMLEYIFRDRRTAIEKYCDANFRNINNKIYKEKRGATGGNLYLNELITPEAYEVQKFKKPFKKVFKEKLLFMRKAGNALAKMTTWFDESKLTYNDVYLFPRETLTTNLKKCDCEDLAFVMASLDPDNCGVAFGKWLPNGSVIWHSFPYFLFQGVPYTIETTGYRGAFKKLDDTTYIPYLIVTQNRTYEVKQGVKFGKEVYL